jgi:hypothetical protein
LRRCLPFGTLMGRFRQFVDVMASIAQRSQNSAVGASIGSSNVRSQPLTLNAACLSCRHELGIPSAVGNVNAFLSK